MIRKFAAIAVIAALSGSVVAAPAEANSGAAKAATGVVKVVKWVFSPLLRGGDDALDVLKAAPKQVPIPAYAPAGLDALADARAVPMNKMATFVYDRGSNLAKIYDDTGTLVSTYPIEQTSSFDFEFFTGKITITTLLKTRYLNIKGGDLNLYTLVAKVGLAGYGLRKCNGTECIGRTLSKVLRCLAGTSQVSVDGRSGDLTFTCTAQLAGLNRR